VALSCLLPRGEAALPDSAKSPVVKVSQIFIIGNKKTQPDIILREVNIEKDAYYGLDELRDLAEKGRMRIYNTNLFNEVSIQVLETMETEVDILIRVEERWYFYPSPLFRIADRNLMDWLINRDGQLNRFNYGLKLDQYNLRGRNERLRFIGQLGFERRFLLSYSIPYIESSQRHGLSMDLVYNERENMPYITRDHVPVFLDVDQINRTSFQTAVTYSYRPSYYSFHYFTTGFQKGHVSDTIALLNPNYYGNGRTDQQFFRLRYSFVNDQRNNRNFPTEGHYAKMTLEQFGLGAFDDVGIFTAELTLDKYNQLGHGFYLANSLFGHFSTPAQQPYYNYTALGYNDIFARGFELDVIEGPHYFLSKNSLRFQLLDTKKDMAHKMKIDQFNDFKLAMYLKLFCDMGWVTNYPNYEVNNRLTDTYLYSIGTGLDFKTMYDLIFRLEYSYNSEREFNFAINLRADI